MASQITIIIAILILWFAYKMGKEEGRTRATRKAIDRGTWVKVIKDLKCKKIGGGPDYVNYHVNCTTYYHQKCTTPE